MKKIKRLTTICLVLAVLCAGVAVWAVTGQLQIARLNGQLKALQAQLNAPQSTSNAADPTAIVAEFNGGAVTAAEAAEEYALLAAYYELLGQTEAEYEEVAKQTVLDGLVEAKVLEMKAREMGVFDQSEAEAQAIEAQVQAQYEDNIRYYMEFRFDESKSNEEVRAETIEYLNQSGLSYEEMLAEAQRNAWQQRLYDVVTADMNIGDEQLRAFYESELTSAELAYSANYAEYESDAEAGRTMVWNPEGVRRVQAIEIPFTMDQAVEYLSLRAALDSGDGNAQMQMDALYQDLEATAQQMLDRLNASEDFTALQAEIGGMDRYVSAQSTLCGEAFRDAALALQGVGDISGLVRTDGGVCILRYAADVPAGPVAFEEVREALRPAYEAEIKLSQYNETVAQWVQDAGAKYYMDRF